MWKPCCPSSVPFRINDPVEVAPGVTARWVEAGHMLGSASIHLTLTDAGGTATAVFSGDLGPKGAPILKDAEPFHQAQTVFLESTYGARNHKPFQETVQEFIGVLQTAISRNGKVLVPTFAVGRATAARHLGGDLSQATAAQVSRSSWTARWPSRRRRSTVSMPSCSTMI